MAHVESQAFRNARTLLYLVLLASVVSVLRRAYDVAFHVDTSRVGLLFLYVAFPLIQAALTALALALLRLHLLAGGILGAALIGYVGLRIGLAGATGPGTIGNVSTVISMIVGLGILWIAVRLCVEGVSWPSPKKDEPSSLTEPQL